MQLCRMRLEIKNLSSGKKVRIDIICKVIEVALVDKFRNLFSGVYGLMIGKIFRYFHQPNFSNPNLGFCHHCNTKFGNNPKNQIFRFLCYN